MCHSPLEAYALVECEVRMQVLNPECDYHACVFFYNIFSLVFPLFDPILAYICWDFSSSP
jgi:hypothetical protein